MRFSKLGPLDKLQVIACITTFREDYGRTTDNDLMSPFLGTFFNFGLKVGSGGHRSAGSNKSDNKSLKTAADEAFPH